MLLLISLNLFLIVWATTEPPNNLDAVVKIKSGLVRGIQYKTVSQKLPYYGFRGIPYAEPPIRFQSPIPKLKWNGIFNATNDGNVCIQGVNPVIGSEDCLFINVYTTNLKSTTKLLPVYVFIYGGAFIGGQSNYENFGPDYLLEKELIVVTFNYRIGIFGFLATEDSNVPGNNGLKDQILALKWVNENIKSFGGDNGKVTLGGQSAGSACVAYLVQSPRANKLFHRAIMESGTSLSLWSLNRQAIETTIAIGKSLLLDTSNTTKLINKMKTITAKTLQLISIVTVVTKITQGNPRDGLLIAPVIEPADTKDAVITVKMYDSLKKGQFNKIPCLVGFNSLEGYFPQGDLMKVFLKKYDLNPSGLSPIDLNIKNKNVKRTIGLKIKSFYFNNGSVIDSHKNTMQFISDDQFVRPTYEFVKLISKYIPTYFYQFSYKGELGFPNRTFDGVSHSEELNYLWISKNNATKQDEKVKGKMLLLWSNFIKTGNPTPEINGILDGVRWLSTNYTLDHHIKYLDINENLTLKYNPEFEQIKFWNNIYNTYGNPPYDTY